MMTKRMVCVVSLMGGFVMGCGGSSAMNTTTDPRDMLENSVDVLALEKRKNSLTKKIVIVDKKASMSPDGRIQVQSKILNKTNKVMKILVQTVFNDESGYPVDQSNFELAVIPASAYHYYRAESLNDKARSFVIRIKLPEKA